MKIKEFVIMPSSIDAMGLIHKPGTGPNNRFDFKNKGNNRGNETKEAPPGTYFTKQETLSKAHCLKMHENEVPERRIQKIHKDQKCHR